MFRKIILGISILSVTASFSQAGRFSHVCEWLNINPSPRASGLGVAFYGISDGAEAALFNPAAPALINIREIKAHHGMMLSEMMYDSFFYLEPAAGRGSASFSAQYYATGNMQEIREGVLADSFNNYDIAVNLGYGYPLTETVALGVNVKGIQSSLAGLTGQSFGGDFGVYGRPFANTVYGVGLHNFSTPLSYRSKNETLPLYVSLGASQKVILPSEDVSLTFAFGARYLDYGEWEAGLGMEHTAFDQFSLRVGYQLSTEDRKLSFPANLSVGAGLNISGVLVDYAWVPFGELGYTQRFGLGYRFGAEKKIERKIVLSAEPYMYSPAAGKLKIASRWVNVDEIESWEIVITDSYSIKVRTMSGSTKGDYAWDGKDDSGYDVLDGNYAIQLTAKPVRGRKIVSNTAEVIIDSTPPEFNIKYSTGLFSPNGDGDNDTLAMRLSGYDSNMFDSYKVKIFNKGGTLVKTFEGSSLPAEIVWDGKDDYYKEKVHDGDYFFVASAKDAAGNTNVLEKKKITVRVAPKVVTKRIKVDEDERGLKINLTSKVLFDSGKGVLKKASHESMQEVVQVLNAYPENRVSVEGHTDSVGSAAYNKKLSLKRAQAVANYLIKNGVDKNRITVVGHGEEKPIAPNTTRAGRAENRRVEVIILK